MAKSECLQAGMELTKPACLDNINHLLKQFIIENKEMAQNILQPLIASKKESFLIEHGLGRDLPDTEENCLC
jgi:hypothetical protein